MIDLLSLLWYRLSGVMDQMFCLPGKRRYSEDRMCTLRTLKLLRQLNIEIDDDDNDNGSDNHQVPFIHEGQL